MNFILQQKRPKFSGFYICLLTVNSTTHYIGVFEFKRSGVYRQYAVKNKILGQPLTVKVSGISSR